MAKTSVTVADKILDQTGPKDEARARASRMKLQSLTLLARLGDRDAEATLSEFAETLVNGGDSELAAEAAQIVLVGDAQKVLKDQDVTGAESVVTRINALLEKDPDDGAIAQFAMQFAGALEHMPEGSEAAGKAYAAFGGAFVKSSNPQIKAMGEGMAGMLRRLGLIGNEMEIRGTNLDGQAFDQKTLDG